MAEELFALLTEAKTVYLQEVKIHGKQYRRYVEDFVNSHRYIDCDNAVCRNCHEMNIHIVKGLLTDCPPSLSLLTLNALTASDQLIIPVQAQYLAMRGMAKLMQVVSKVQQRLNSDLKIAGVLITQYDGRKNLNKSVSELVQETFQGKVFSTHIRNAIALAEAPTQGQDIFHYAPKSAGAEDYESVCNELLMGKMN